MIHVSEINDAAELANIRLLWESLWLKTRDASYLQSFDWFDSYRRHFGRKEQLKVLVVTLAAKPIGILPLVIRHSMTGVGAVRVLSYAQSDLGNCSGPIGPNSAATLISAMRYLRNSRRDWDICDLHQVDVNRRDRGRTRNALRAAGMKFLTRPDKETAVIDFDTNWIDYWGRRPIATRRRYHQAERRLKGAGQLEYLRFRPNARVVSDAGCRWELFDEFLEAAYGTNAEGPMRRAFLRELHSRAALSATVDLNVLRLDGRAIAASYGFCVDGQVDVIESGCSSNIADDASRVLAARMLQDGAKRGDRCYRIADNARQFAGEWKTGKVDNERLTHFAPTAPKAQILRLNQNLHDWLGRFSRATAALNF